jgi:hypothetical protein
MEEEYKPRISNREWWAVVWILGCIDLAQFVLDFFAVGLVVDTFVDVVVGMGFGLYLQMKGQSLATPKRLFAFLGALGLEFIPVINAFPLWVLDGLYNKYIAQKKDEEMRIQFEENKAKQLELQKASLRRRIYQSQNDLEEAA